MSHPTPSYTTIDDWITREAIPFSVDLPERFNAAVDRLIASLGSSLELLGLGEALHGGEDILILRNQLFQRLVEAHGYSAIAIESSFPRAHSINEYIAGRGPEAYESVQETGFSHGFGQFVTTRELVEWMRQYNADPSHTIKLRFYGFDTPTEMMSTDSPSRVLHFVLDYLTAINNTVGEKHRQHIDALLGPDSAWENPAAMFDPAKSVGGSAEAVALRIATEELIAELNVRRPELVEQSDESRFLEAMHYASIARQLLNYHAAVARPSNDRTAWLLGIRDAAMADNLAYAVAHERGRGKVLAFAHNSHLKYGKAQWQLGPDLLTWWPAGAHLHAMFGPRYAVIGSAVGVSDGNGIAAPEPGTLEALLTTAPGPVRFIPTHKGYGLPSSAIAVLQGRSGSTKNSSYFALTPQSLIDFDWLVTLDSTTYARGGPPLPG